MKTSSIIIIIIIIILLAVGLYLFYNQNIIYGNNNNQVESQLDQIPESEFENIQTENEVLSEIDNSIELLE